MGEVYVPTRVKKERRAILLVASEAKLRSKRSERLGSLFPKGGADKDAEHLPWDANGENSGTACIEITACMEMEKRNMDSIWDTLYQEAKKVLHPRKVSAWMEAGGVAAAIEATSGHIYTGVCVDGACTLGICAERNAIFQMLTQGEDEIRRVIAVKWDGTAMPPCGACRELMTQLMPEHYREIEILLNYENKEVVTLGELTPKWWI